MEKGFICLAAIIDLSSRFVLNWSVSNNMEADWCAEMFKKTVAMYSKPDIIKGVNKPATYLQRLFYQR